MVALALFAHSKQGVGKHASLYDALVCTMTTTQVSVQKRNDYHQTGFVLAPGLFSAEETACYREHYMEMRAAGTYPGDFAGIDPQSNDPLKKYPRLIHMHRWDPVSLAWLIDARLRAWMTSLLGQELYAVQTMLYFKPPGARGQALHQDQYYLKVQPGTCLAAWLTLDRSDEENGCLQVVPGSQTLPVLCATKADTRQSFTDVTVPLPAGVQPVPVVMEAGDVLFFHGQLIHGSYPNTSPDRFRRAHPPLPPVHGGERGGAAGEAEQVAKFYHPALRMDGSEVCLGVSEGGGPCGVWVEREGATTVELRSQ